MDDRPIEESELRWLGCDLDGTIAENTGHPHYFLIRPLPGAVEALKKLNEEGWKIIIFTSRSWEQYRAVESFLDEWEIPHRRILMGKPLFKWMIDDRNIAFRGDWKEVLQQIGG